MSNETILILAIAIVLLPAYTTVLAAAAYTGKVWALRYFLFKTKKEEDDYSGYEEEGKKV